MKRFTWLLACLLIFSPLYVHAAKSRKVSGTKNGGNKKSFVYIGKQDMDSLKQFYCNNLPSSTEEQYLIFGSTIVYANEQKEPSLLLERLIRNLKLAKKRNYRQAYGFILQRMYKIVASQGEEKFDFLINFIREHYCFFRIRDGYVLTYDAGIRQYHEVYWLLYILLHLEGKEEQKNEAKIFADEICKNYESMKRILFKKLKK